jgi:hypothetical protein
MIGQRAYNTVVIPPGMENIDMASFMLLKKYVDAGGKIIQFNDLKYIDGSANKMLDDFYKEKYPTLIRHDSLNDAVIRKEFSDENFVIEKDESSPGDLYHYRRKLPEGEIIFLANSSMEQSAKGNIKTNGADILRMDLFSGQINGYPYQKLQNSLSATFDIPPAGSLLLFYPNKKSSVYKTYEPPAYEGSPENEKTIVERSTDNSLTIDFCDVKIGDTLMKNMNVYYAADTVFKHYGFNDGNPWNTSVQYKNNTIKRDTFSKGTGFTADYYFNIKDAIDLSALKAVVEMQSPWKVLINDYPISPITAKYWIDKALKIFSIGKFVHQGINKISVIANPMSVYAEIEPVYILGDFDLSPAQKGWDIIKSSKLELGSWKNQGMPMYGQTVSYTKEINITDISKKYFVQLGEWKGTLAAIKVNKKDAGVIMIQPYDLDISKYLTKGKNIIQVNVIGSLKNTLGPHHRKPVPGLVSPWHWRYVKNYPSGKDYDLYDYGLMQDFQVIQQTKKIRIE